MMVRDSAKQKALTEEYRFRDKLAPEVVTAAGGDPGTGNYATVAAAAGMAPTTLESLVQQAYWPLDVSAQVAEGLGYASLEAAIVPAV